MMHEREKSDPAIGAGKPTNKADATSVADAAEPVEQSAGAEGNASEQSTHRTQGRERVSQALERVRQAARLRKEEKFTALLHHINLDLLREAFFALKRDAAVLAVMAPDHRLRRRAVLDVVDVAADPLLLLTRAFAAREWFYSACQAARIRPNIIFESAAPQTLISLAAAGDGIAVVPQGVLISHARVHAVPLVYRGVPIGRWHTIAWNPQRFLAPYAHHFVEELVTYARANYPNRDLTRRAPPMPRPKGWK